MMMNSFCIKIPKKDRNIYFDIISKKYNIINNIIYNRYNSSNIRGSHVYLYIIIANNERVYLNFCSCDENLDNFEIHNIDNELRELKLNRILENEEL